MSLRTAIARVVQQEDLNFLLTNRIPRLALTRFMGWFSKLENPLVRYVSIALWRFFCDVDLTDSAEPHYRSLHAAFIRRLRPGARTVEHDPHVLTSPCDAIVGAFGPITAGQAYQIKGFPYSIGELLGAGADAGEFQDGWYMTLRLTAGSYHRFHAPHDILVERVRYISGDTWNVNPIALKRIEKLFCKNERAPITARLQNGGGAIVLVPVAAVLVASIRLPFLDRSRGVRDGGERVERCSCRFSKGEEMGWFEHGSTIVLLLPSEWSPCSEIAEGNALRMGMPLFRRDVA
ncbi:MAG: archaetidylserine decarboxylase [Novosphingobium sp.]